MLSIVTLLRSNDKVFPNRLDTKFMQQRKFLWHVALLPAAHTNALNSVSMCFLTLFSHRSPTYFFFSLLSIFLMISHANETWHTFYFITHRRCVADINFCTQWPLFSDLLQGAVVSSGIVYQSNHTTFFT